MPDEDSTDASQRFSPEAASRMREAIAATGGREVFFAGSLDASGIVTSIRVWARGTLDAVPAVIHGLEKGEVVIHNHPSGDVLPSDADLQMASIYGFQGHGVYIINNTVDLVFVVVEPFLEHERAQLDPVAMARHLAPQGPMANVLPQFEVRPQQLEMLRAVTRAFNDDGILVVEAPTGVGKTIAYLLPSVAWALDNRERIVVSTKTINLQEQIIHKDAPVLAKCLGRPFTAVIVKGRGNYLCRRRFERMLSESELLADTDEQEELRRLAEWVEKTQEGSLSDLPYVPRKDLWAEICSEADTCRMTSCSAARECFVLKARREIAKADVLVVNHHMLFSDMAIKREMGSYASAAVLPAYKRLILDEAHSMEDSATEYFGATATRIGAMALLGRFLRKERGQDRGLLPYLKQKLIREAPNATQTELDALLELIDDEFLPALEQARASANAAFDVIRNLCAAKCGQVGRDIKWRLTEKELADPELREVHAVYVLPAVEDMGTVARRCRSLHDKLKALNLTGDELREPPFLEEMAQLVAFGERVARTGITLAESTSERLEPNTVRWVEISADNPRIVRVVRCPLEVGESLAEGVYDQLKTVVMTSATLSVRKRFGYLFQRTGLDLVQKRMVDQLALPTPFDYANQALLGIVTDLPDPGSSGFQEQSVDCIREALLITGGHAFVLFTSFSALGYAARKLGDELRQRGIALLRQGEAARTQLLDRFRSDTSSVLFATDSFWEGVDVAGDALQCVILPKLPFRVPTEPILEARAEAIDKAGGSSFMDYSVPQAVIKFRQGFGRLIRRKTDWGSILVLDRRVVTKHYGRVFLESLPDMKMVKESRAGVMTALRRFYEEKKGN